MASFRDNNLLTRHVVLEASHDKLDKWKSLWDDKLIQLRL